jgi:heme-degrading monooxygenase HmoA
MPKRSPVSKDRGFGRIPVSARKEDNMYAVIFEVQPRPGRTQDYLDIAAALRPELERIDGFLSIERFQSLSTEGKILSLSFWRDAEAVQRWREHDQHRRAQARGRGEIFADYRLSVVEVVRQYGLFDRAQAPQP